MDLFKEISTSIKAAHGNFPNMSIQTTDQIDDQCRADLREMMMFYGSWEALRKVIKELEDNDKDAAWERHNNDY